MYFKLFVLSCSLFVTVKCTPIGGEEILQTNEGKENAAHRMLVWPPRITKKNVSDEQDLRLIGGPQEALPTAIVRNTGSQEAQDRSDTNKEQEITLNASMEETKNETHEINQTLKPQSNDSKEVEDKADTNNEKERTLNSSEEKPNNGPQGINQTSKSGPGNFSVNIESIQLTTSEPQIIPSIETVAIFRNAGFWRNGNNSYSVEVEEVPTNATEETPKNQSQTRNGESIIQRNLESSSANASIITTEEKGKDKTEVTKTHVSESLEHNTEIYGKTAAEELAELSVIDVLLRKRRKAATVERVEPEDDDSSKEILSSEEESGEILKSNNQSNSSLEERDTLFNESNNVNNTSTLEKISLTSSVNETKNENSNPTLIAPLIALSEVRHVNTQILPEEETKLDLNNTNSTTIHTLELTHSEVRPVYLLDNSSYNINTSSESIVSNQKGREKKRENMKVEISENNATASNKLLSNKNQSINASPVITTFQNVPNHGNKVEILSPNENISHSVEETLENSTALNKTTQGWPDNDTSSTPVLIPGESVPSTTIVLTKYSAASQIDDESTNKDTIEEVSATTEVTKHNISQSNIEGKNLHDIDQRHSESSTESKMKTITDVFSSHNNYIEVSNETLTVLPSEKDSTVTQKVITSMEKENEVKKETTTEKGTIFEGFKSIAEYIGFTD